MIVLIHEIDYSSQAANIWVVDDTKCPGRLRKKIKDSIVDKKENIFQTEILTEDSITYGQFDDLQNWTLKPPCKIDQIIIWHIYE